MQVELWLRGKKGGKSSGQGMGCQHDEQFGAWQEAMDLLRRNSDSGDFAWPYSHVHLVWAQEEEEAAKRKGRGLVKFVNKTENVEGLTVADKKYIEHKY